MWASIAKSPSKRTNKCPKLLVEYNVSTDRIANHKTNTISQESKSTPDPADDFIMTNGWDNPWVTTALSINHWSQWKNSKWIDYNKDKCLKAFKEALPLSVQCIIEFANKLYANKEVIDLNFKAIQKDLRYQYYKYNGDRDFLKKMYYNYYPNYRYH